MLSSLRRQGRATASSPRIPEATALLSALPDPVIALDRDNVVRFVNPAAEQFYVGMRTDENGVVTFEYGTVATAVVGLVIGVPTETKIGDLGLAQAFTQLRPANTCCAWPGQMPGRYGRLSL